MLVITRGYGPVNFEGCVAFGAGLDLWDLDETKSQDSTAKCEAWWMIREVPHQFSIGWFKGKITGKSHDLHEKIGMVSGVDFPLSQAIDH